MDEELYRTYGPMILRRCRFLLCNEADAYDAMQDVFVEILKRDQKLDLSKPSSLFYRIATNICLNKIRADKRREKVMLGSSNQVIEAIAGLSSHEGHWLLSKVFTHLAVSETKSTQAMLVMHLIDGMTLQSISEYFDTPLSTVRRRINSARERIMALRG